MGTLVESKQSQKEMTLTQNDIEYRRYKLGGVVDPRVVDTRLRFRDIARIGRTIK